jgi:MFS transporter, YNFM family, putative membrane transport protein
VTTASTPAPGRTPTRAIAFLAGASFASLSAVRVTDTLLPQVAADLGTTVGAASAIVTAYAVTHGSIQLVIGPVGDRFGKYPSVAVACALAALTALASGFADSLTTLALARLASGLCAGWIIPLSMAFVGDVTPYERRQQVLGRYLSGQITGLLFGQAAGGILGDLLGWRGVFFLLAALFALAAAALAFELVTNPLTRRPPPGTPRARGFVADYRIVFGNPWARIVLLAVLLEGIFLLGPLTYVGADLHLRFGLSFTLIGAVVGAFGAGGLVYAFCVDRLVAALGQHGLAWRGGLVVGTAYLVLAPGLSWWLAPVATAAIGLGYYMLHSTLQTNATQMSPQARGTAVGVFSSAMYLGQMLGVAGAAPVVDRVGAAPIFVIAAAVTAALGLWFSRRLAGHEPLR